MAPRVLMFGWEFPPKSSGGLGVACYGLTRALARQGAKITFVLPRRMETSYDFVDFASANLGVVQGIGVQSLLYPYLTEQSYYALTQDAPDADLYGRSLYEEVMAYGARAAAVVRGRHFDVIHAHDWLSFPAGVRAQELSGKPLVVHVHATEFDRTGGMGVNPRVYAVERAGLLAANRVIAVSNLTKNIIVERYGIPPEKIHVVHNGIDVNEFKKEVCALDELKAHGRKLVLFHGRVTLQKGPDYFISVARRVLEFEPNTVFVVSGSGDMLPQIIRQAAALGIADKVFFTGPLWGEERDRVYRTADVVLMPSVSEPFGIVPLEAMALGAPVLISKQSGVSEVLGHALKADFWDVDEMANKIVTLLKNPQLAQTLRGNGGTEVGNVSWERAARECMDVYRTLLPTHALG